MRQFIRRAMLDHDEFVVEFEYIDSKGAHSRRVVSPIRFLAANRFLGLCLSREEPRQFCLDRCKNLRLKKASEYLMPVAM